LMDKGYTVVLAGRRIEMLEETAKLGPAGKSLCVSADMANPAAIAALFDRVKATYGRLDVLFNNAGMGAPPVNFEDLPLEQWQAVVNTNLTAPFLCTQHAFRIMKDQKPRRGRSLPPTPRPSTPSPASPSPPTSTGACMTSRSARSISAMPRPR
jgi:NAD(P)-dependent dehydrogenase (short-subunit alcohol dehydrogenase family)